MRDVRVIIERAQNGWVVTQRSSEYLRSEDDTPDIVNVFDEKDSEVEGCASLLRHLEDVLGPSTSRYDEKRIYIVVAPGDKNDAFTEAHSDVIWPDSVEFKHIGQAIMEEHKDALESLAAKGD